MPLFRWDESKQLEATDSRLRSFIFSIEMWEILMSIWYRCFSNINSLPGVVLDALFFFSLFSPFNIYIIHWSTIQFSFILIRSIQYGSCHGLLRSYNIHQWSRLWSSKRRTQMPNPLFDWWDTNNTITTRKAQEMSQMATEFIKYGFKGCRETDSQMFSLTNISQETTIPHVFNFTIFLSRKGDGTQNVMLEETQVSAWCWAVDVTVAVPTAGKCPG